MFLCGYFGTLLGSCLSSRCGPLFRFRGTHYFVIPNNFFFMDILVNSSPSPPKRIDSQQSVKKVEDKCSYWSLAAHCLLVGMTMSAGFTNKNMSRDSWDGAFCSGTKLFPAALEVKAVNVETHDQPGRILTRKVTLLCHILFREELCLSCIDVVFGLFGFGFWVLQAFENAITVMYALGGSTNGVLHLLALAHE